MYEFIDGHFISRDPEGRLILHNAKQGMGYQIQTLSRDWKSVDRETAEVRVWVRAVFNEATGYALYGFEDPLDRRAFDVLRKAQGVGGKVAMTILSALTIHELATATIETFKPVKGVGPKVASKIIPELEALQDLVTSSLDGRAGTDAKDETVMALVSIGYPRDKALAAVRSAAQAHPGDDSVALLRAATNILHR